MGSKVLSVIVPSYNMEDYLPKCLGSLVVDDSDLLQKLEVIVVNDGSTDRTSEIAHGFETRFPDVFRVVDKGNGNYGSCINAALPLVSGCYVKVLDADDYVDTIAFETLLRCLESEVETEPNSADLIVTDYESVDPHGSVIDRSRYLMPTGPGRTLNDVKAESPRFSIHSIVYKTALLTEMGYRQTEGVSYSDTEWITDPMVMVGRVTYVPIAVNKYLVGRAGQTMEDSTFAARFQQVVQITEGLVKRFLRASGRCVPTSLAYYQARVEQMVLMVYQAWMFGVNGYRIRCNLHALDCAVRETPAIFDYIKSIRAPFRKYPLRYVYARFQPVTVSIPILVSFKLYLLLRKGWHLMKGLFSKTKPTARTCLNGAADH